MLVTGAVLASPLTFQLKNAIIEYLDIDLGSPATIFTGVHDTYSQGDYASV